MDTSMIGLIGLVLGLVGAIVGAFVYLTGEIRKVSAGGHRELENARDYLISQTQLLARNEVQERNALRNEFIAATGRVEIDLRRLSEAMVRQTALDALETRITRATERLEQKFDRLMSRGPSGTPGYLPNNN